MLTFSTYFWLYFQSTDISENKFKSEGVSKFVKETY